MMQINVLLVNYNADALELYGPLLTIHGLAPRLASTMQEALDALMSCEYSGIAINADNFEYISFLKLMRRLTLAPIGVSVTHYDKTEHDTAIENGADVYRFRYDDAGHRVRNFSTMVKIFLSFNKGQNRALALKACDDIEISLDTRKVLVKNHEIKLGPKEFDVLHCLVINKGLVLTHEQIYLNIWGYDCESDSRQAIWNNISQLRKKLRVSPNQPDYIKTKHGVGYSFDPQHCDY